MELLTTQHFNGCTLDCYVELEYESTGDAWAAREQIGTLLEYAESTKAISNLHKCNSEHPDKFLTIINSRTPMQ